MIILQLIVSLVALQESKHIFTILINFFPKFKMQMFEIQISSSLFQIQLFKVKKSRNR